ncbi:MAG: hypothetical protein JWO19_4388 [Bryobacterales bacterium]|nr:hypothetical protein [Bryobacterales bacterium]
MRRSGTSAQKKLEKYWGPSPDHVYLVRGYATGEFIGRVESVEQFGGIAVLTVLDPLRPYQKGSCPYPQCIGDEDHDGGHIFPTLCAGHTIEVPWRLAQFEPQVEAAPKSEKSEPEKSAKVLEFGRGKVQRPEPRGAA